MNVLIGISAIETQFRTMEIVLQQEMYAEENLYDIYVLHTECDVKDDHGELT